MRLNRIGSTLNRNERNNLNDNFDVIEQSFGEAKKNAEGIDGKASQALATANQADNKSTQALATSDGAMTLVESVQNQFNTVVIEGDSSVEAAQARVSADATVYSTLKARLDAENVQVTRQLAQIDNQVEKMMLPVSKFPRQPSETDDAPRILRALAYADANNIVKIYFDEPEYDLPDVIDIPYSYKRLVGRESYSVIRTPTGKSAIKFEGKVNVGIDKLNVVSQNVSQENPVTANAIGFIFKNCQDVEVGSVKADNLNVGVYAQNCNGVKAKYINPTNMVISSDLTTGYGVNTEGSVNVEIDLIESYNCERHTFYAGAVDKINHRPKDQHVKKIIAKWDKGFQTPSPHQAAFKTFHSTNVTAGEIHVEGLMYAVWISGEAISPKVGSIFAKNLYSVPIHLYSYSIDEVVDYLQIDSLDIESNTFSNFSAIQARFITINRFVVDNIFVKNYDAVIDGNHISNPTYGSINAKNCNRIFQSQITYQVPTVGDIWVENVPEIERNYTNTNVDIIGTVLDVGTNTLINVITPGLVNEIKGGYNGMLLHIYFNSDSFATLVHSQTLNLQNKHDTRYPRSTHATFIKNRGAWWELSNNVSKTGSTALRPTNPPISDKPYFDTSLKKPIWWSGTNWVDANGTTV